MKVLQVNTFDEGGGAERIATTLLHAYRARGIDCWMAVGNKRGDDPHVVQIPGSLQWTRFWRARQAEIPHRGAPLIALRRFLGLLAEPARELNQQRGIEHHQWPASRRIDRLIPTGPPDILHLHNLHGDYFDLRVLSALSRRIPTVITMHDAWLLTGHCAHSFDCQRWITGCGQCPDLLTPPAIRRDNTARNWKQKRQIYARSRLHIATPSAWLMEKVSRSILSQAAIESRVIHNGIDLSIFRPDDRAAARARLGIPLQAQVLLFTANGIRDNPFKDFPMMRRAVASVARSMRGKPLIFLALGEDGPPEQVDGATITFVPYRKDPQDVAMYYQAADLYLHPARADTFPNTVLEALACGTPVIATAVGGIPEQVKTLGNAAAPTGVLVPPGDAEAMAAAIVRLLSAPSLLCELSRNAAADARERFDLNLQVDRYVQWYEQILQQRGAAAASHSIGTSRPISALE
jgi:glycosyltransferase involved in cell wall biosynthesis